MKILRFISIILIIISSVSCSEPNMKPDWMSVPVIIGMKSDPNIHSAILSSELKKETKSNILCGFYVGKDPNNLAKVFGTMNNQSFSAKVVDLDENSMYWYKAFISNGVNEICSNFDYFKTEKTPVHEPEPEKPAKFNADIAETSSTVIEKDITLSAVLSGSIYQIKECYFMIGSTQNSLYKKLTGKIEASAMTASIKNQNPGIYWFKAVISNGTEKKESTVKSFEVVKEQEPELPPEPPKPIEFTATIGETNVIINTDQILFSASLAGNITQIKESYFMVGTAPESMNMKISGNIDQTSMNAAMNKPESGTYWFKAVISDGTTTKESEAKSFIVKKIEEPLPDPPAPPQPEPSEFTAEITEIKTNLSGDILDITAHLSGDITQITEGYFQIGTNKDNMKKIQGAIIKNTMNGYMISLPPGNYMIIGYITNGTVTKESGVITVEIP